MKRFLMFVMVVLFLAVFAACGGGENVPPAVDYVTENGTGNGVENVEPVTDPLRVIATIFPQYDFVRRIGGGRVDLSLLISPGAESHGFEPTPRDMIEIGQADLLIHVGGHKDDWVAPILAAVGQEDMPTIALLDMVEAIVVEHTEDCDDDECDFPHHVEHYDEHVWTCPRNVIIIAEELANILAEKDPANAEFFRTNAAEFITELQELDRAFIEVVENGVRSTIVFGDRFPFLYFVNTYGLTHFSAFDGCCVDTQVSPATIASMITLVRDEEIPVVFHIELSNRAIANTIAEDTGAQLLEFHSAHNVTHADFNNGVTYLDLMWRNLENLRIALN
ncbi:MAG: metal ABC transporter substrate-binding protein [Defluviitaleaceae bacterium]|nr:metal ABC transporter substrate-binding protein [Defluviitaleaceae bacterium]MCL2263239.1 metal ABC transporter substrate-binding protein [Defluviitaleaceae bacterium]